MRRERTTRIGVCVLLLATVALTGCRFAEHSRRAAIDAFASFVLDSVSQAPLTQAAPSKVSGGQASVPVLAAAAVTPPSAQARQECVVSINIALPKPQPRIASIDLAPAAAAMARVKSIVVCPDIARAQVEARMALAEVRGMRPDRVRRIVVVIPEGIPEPPPVPATL
jgi:hypothetical protein